MSKKRRPCHFWILLWFQQSFKDFLILPKWVFPPTKRFDKLVIFKFLIRLYQHVSYCSSSCKRVSILQSLLILLVIVTRDMALDSHRHVQMSCSLGGGLFHLPSFKKIKKIIRPLKIWKIKIKYFLKYWFLVGFFFKFLKPPNLPKTAISFKYK